MTDDRRFYVLGKGRLIFDSFDPPSRMSPEPLTWTGKFDVSGSAKASILFLLGRPYIPTLVGHDPQKLLPPPQHFGREPSFSEEFCLSVGHTLGLTYNEITRDESYEEPEPTRWKKAVIVVGDDTKDVARLIAMASIMHAVVGIDIDIQPSSGYLPPDLFLPRWNGPDATPLEDIARWREQFDRAERFEAVRPNHQMQMYALGVMLDAPMKAERVAATRDKGYLKHDPTKTHNRRRRRK